MRRLKRTEFVTLSIFPISFTVDRPGRAQKNDYKDIVLEPIRVRDDNRWIGVDMKQEVTGLEKEK